MGCTLHAEFELDSFRQKMDEQGMAVAENQESSLKSRRRLAETTRGDALHFLRSEIQQVLRTHTTVSMQNSRRVHQQSSTGMWALC